MAPEFISWLRVNGVLARNAVRDKAFLDEELISACGLQLWASGDIADRKAWWSAESAVSREHDAVKKMENLPETISISQAEAKHFVMRNNKIKSQRKRQIKNKRTFGAIKHKKNRRQTQIFIKPKQAREETTNMARQKEKVRKRNRIKQ